MCTYAQSLEELHVYICTIIIGFAHVHICMCNYAIRAKELSAYANPLEELMCTYAQSINRMQG